MKHDFKADTINELLEIAITGVLDQKVYSGAMYTHWRNSCHCLIGHMVNEEGLYILEQHNYTRLEEVPDLKFPAEVRSAELGVLQGLYDGCTDKRQFCRRYLAEHYPRVYRISDQLLERMHRCAEGDET